MGPPCTGAIGQTRTALLHNTPKVSTTARQRLKIVWSVCFRAERAADGSTWNATASRSTVGSTPQTLLNWVRQHERETGQREGVTTAESKRVKELEREVRGKRLAVPS